MPSSEQLATLAQQSGYREATLEKVLRLLELLADIDRHPLLSQVLVLKGGTALHLGFGQPQRLSVDLASITLAIWNERIWNRQGRK